MTALLFPARRFGLLLLALISLLLPSEAWAPAGPAITSTAGPNGSQTWAPSIQTLAMLTMMPFLPAALLMMTGFTRVIIVLGLLRNAMGTGTAPPNTVLVGLALFLTFFVMSPVFDQVYQDAYKPLSENKISFE